MDEYWKVTQNGNDWGVFNEWFDASNEYDRVIDLPETVCAELLMIRCVASWAKNPQ